MGQVFVSGGAQEQAGAVEEAARAIQPAAAHRWVSGIDLVFQVECRGARAIGAPGGFVELHQRDHAPGLHGAHALQVLGELAQQVAARNPGGQLEQLAGLRCLQPHAHAVQMGMWVVRFHHIVHGASRCALGRWSGLRVRRTGLIVVPPHLPADSA